MLAEKIGIDNNGFSPQPEIWPVAADINFSHNFGGNVKRKKEKKKRYRIKVKLKNKKNLYEFCISR